MSLSKNRAGWERSAEFTIYIIENIKKAAHNVSLLFLVLKGPWTRDMNVPPFIFFIFNSKDRKSVVVGNTVYVGGGP